MMKFRVLKLGTECTDKATGLEGTLTHWIMDMGRSISYIFQPRGLDDKGQPISRLLLCKERLEVSEADFEEIEVPFEILGTQVEDKASGFSGIAVEFIRHINGCFHVDIQPPGTLKDKNVPIKASEFDLRQCRGEMIMEMSTEEQRKSEEDTPSPTGDTFGRVLPSSSELNASQFRASR